MTADDPQQLLGLVPYLLGFEPEDSVVLVGFSGDIHRVTMRLDLAAFWCSESCFEEAARFAAVADQHSLDALVVIVYAQSWDASTLVLDEFVPALAARLEAAGSMVGDVHLVIGERWWWLTCSDEAAGEWPFEGRPLELGNTRTAAEAVYAGMTKLGSRRELEATATPPEPDRAAFVAACRWSNRQQPEKRVSALASMLDRAVADPGALGDEDHRRLGALVRNVENRDRALARITRENAPPMVETWTQVVRQTPTPLRPHPLCLLGLAAWLGGSGSLLLVCAEEAQRIDPYHRLAALLLGIVDNAIDPNSWGEVVI